jgi:1-acyl-sn-glycerol-3-phosphate acyltransferase
LFCTLATLWRARKPESPLYALAHDFAMRQLKPLGDLLRRFGAVRASSANARRVLDHGGQVLVYPGGDLEAYRHFQKRNEIVILPRTGFARVARDCGVPIVPIVSKGAHRSAIIFAEGKRIARALKMDSWARLERFPLAFALPWGVAIGPWIPYLPLPLPIRMRILEPIAADADPKDTAQHVQQRMQQALDAL